MSYESVPDVEQGDEIPTSEILIQKAQKRYPEAGSAVEAEFLGRLDDAIDNCKPEIKIPRLSPAHFGNSKDGEESSQGSGYMELIKSLKFPTVALSVTIVSAFVVIVISSPLARAMFPYYACALSFLSSIPSIKKRFLDKIGAVFDKMASVKTGAEQKVQGISDKGMHYLDMTEKAMNRALAPIKGKLAVATKFESMLKKVDPTIDIPDTTDIERSFDGYEGELKGAFDGMQGMVDISRNLPAPLQSIEKFQIYVVAPFLAIVLILQLVSVYYLQTADTQVVEEDGIEIAMNATLRRLLLPEPDNDYGIIVNVTNSIDLNATAAANDANDAGSDENEWALVWLSIQAYVKTVVTIVVAFVLTQVRIIVALTNSQIGQLERNVNGTLREKAGSVFESVFQKGFGSVKAKFLRLVHKVDLIEQPLRKLQSKLPGSAGLMGKFMKW